MDRHQIAYIAFAAVDCIAAVALALAGEILLAGCALGHALIYGGLSTCHGRSAKAGAKAPRSGEVGS